MGLQSCHSSRRSALYDVYGAMARVWNSQVWVRLFALFWRRDFDRTSCDGASQDELKQ